MPDPAVPCRSCGGHGLRVFLSLGKTPLADALVRPADVAREEDNFPLDVAFCPTCSLVQILEEVPAEKLFVDNYLYFSSFSPQLLEHSRQNALALVESQHLGPDSLVVELASNDGYLLKNFVELGVPVLGIDPAPTQADTANAAGVPTLAAFFDTALAHRLRAEGRVASVIIANNVMAHVPDLNGFVEGMSVLLGPDGVATVENPYVRDLITHREFDTVYHEHFCYYSCTAVDHLMRRHGLYLNHVEHFADLHGGTLRWHVSHSEHRSATALRYLDEEAATGLTSFEYYEGFGREVAAIKGELLALLEGLRAEGRTVAAYGAAAKGSTLLNYVGIGTDLVEFVVDRNVHKQGLLMPGVHQPVLAPEALLERQPDYLLLLAWNFKDEILAQQAEYLRRGGRAIVPVPHPTIL